MSGWWHTPKLVCDSTSAQEFSTYVSTFVCLHFMLSATEGLNSFEELCIIQVATVKSFAKVLNPGTCMCVCMCICGT